MEASDGEATVWVYDYDPAGHLKTVIRNGQAHASYDYDANGNSLSRNTTSGTETGTYDDQDRL